MQAYIQISIIIPTYNRAAILKATYDAVVDSIKNIAAEIIIVNDDKNADKQDITNILNIKNTYTKVVDNRGSGVATARNLGAELAQGELLLFIDDDILVNSRVLDSVLTLHQKFDRILSTPIWEYSDLMKELLTRTPFGRYKLAYDYTPIKGEVGREVPGERLVYMVDSLASFCLSIKRSHYLQLGGMDESFPYAGCEDQDFAMRAKQAGFDLLLDESNLVMHNELDRIKLENWLKRQFNGVQGFVFLCEKFPERKATSLWKENIPIQKADAFKLKLKKIAKLLIRQQPILSLLNFSVAFCENLHLPEALLFKLYTAQAGIYINKGFTKSYKQNAYSPHHG